MVTSTPTDGPTIQAHDDDVTSGDLTVIWVVGGGLVDIQPGQSETKCIIQSPGGLDICSKKRFVKTYSCDK